MKKSEKLSAKQLVAVCLENFVDNTNLRIDSLTATLADEKRGHDEVLDNLRKESILVCKSAIEIALSLLEQLDS